MKLFSSLIITLAIGGIAGFATANAIDTWYAYLNKPFFNPPNWIFAPVWTILYTMMGIALYLIWKLPASAKRNTAMVVFYIQLLINFLWSLIFFNMHQVGFALVDIVLLLAAIIITIIYFKPISKTAAWLMLPYLLWVSFATVLNYAIWYLN